MKKRKVNSLVPRWLGSRRVCPYCREFQLAREFHRRRCRECEVRRKQLDFQTMSQERRLWRAARARAKAKGLEFNLLVEDIVIPEVCPVFGIPMVSPSLDRFDPTRGYTPDNVRVISTRANTIKNDATPEELAQVLAYARGGKDGR